MAEPKVEIRKIRDLGENLNDTFASIRQNFKPLVSSFIVIAGTIMLADTILNHVYQSRAGDVFERLATHDYTENSPLSILDPGFFIVILLGLVNLVAMNVVVVCFVKLYDSSKGQPPTVDQVWQEFKKYFLKVLLYFIPVTVITIAGFAFCLLPGIYLAVVFAPFTLALIVEDQSFGGAWNRCFTIIQDNFWSSLGLYFLVYLLYFMSAMAMSGLIGVVVSVASYFTSRDISAGISITSSVLGVFSFVLYIVFCVSVCLHYFNLVERYDGTGIMRKLDALGQTRDEINNIPEDY